MDINSCIFSGQVVWSKEQRFSGKPWGSINTRIALPKFEFNFRGDLKRVDNPDLWLSIRLSYDDSGNLKKNNQEALDHCNQKSYALVTGGTISDYEISPKDDSGNVISGAPKERRFSLNVSPSNIAFSSRPFEDINLCTFTGYVTEFKSNGSMLLKSSYRAKDGMSYRSIPVITEEKLDGSIKSAKVLVIGAVCGKTPSRDTKLYTVAKKMIKL